MSARDMFTKIGRAHSVFKLCKTKMKDIDKTILIRSIIIFRARSLMVSDLRSETKGSKGSRFESGCWLCIEVSCLQ